MFSRFSIDLKCPRTHSHIGLFVIRPKVALAWNTVNQSIPIVQTHLHFLLTHVHQEGEMEEEVFLTTAYQHVQETFHHLSEWFGEEATVTLDLNMEGHGPDALRDMYREEVALYLGVCAPSNDPAVLNQMEQAEVWGWEFYPFQASETIHAAFQRARLIV